MLVAASPPSWLIGQHLTSHRKPLEVWNLTKEMLGPTDRPKIKLKAKETEGLLGFVTNLLVAQRCVRCIRYSVVRFVLERWCYISFEYFFSRGGDGTGSVPISCVFR